MATAREIIAIKDKGDGACIFWQRGGEREVFDEEKSLSDTLARARELFEAGANVFYHPYSRNPGSKEVRMAVHDDVDRWNLRRSFRDALGYTVSELDLSIY